MYKRNDIVTCTETGKCLGIVKIREYNQLSVTWRIWCKLHSGGQLGEGVYGGKIRLVKASR